MKALKLPICLLLLMFSPLLKGETLTAWSQQDGTAINVYFKSESIPALALTQGGIHVTPHFHHKNNMTWVTWVEKTSHQANHLWVSQLSSSGTVLYKEKLSTQHDDLYSPTIGISEDGQQVALIWVEFDGQTEDLFVRYYALNQEDNGQWTNAEQITVTDEFADDLPNIVAFDQSGLTLSWLHSSRKGNQTVEQRFERGKNKQFKSAFPNLRQEPTSPSLKVLRNATPLVKTMKASTLGIASQGAHKALMGAVQTDSAQAQRFKVK